MLLALASYYKGLLDVQNDQDLRDGLTQLFTRLSFRPPNGPLTKTERKIYHLCLGLLDDSNKVQKGPAEEMKPLLQEVREKTPKRAHVSVQFSTPPASDEARFSNRTPTSTPLASQRARTDTFFKKPKEVPFEEKKTSPKVEPEKVVSQSPVVGPTKEKSVQTPNKSPKKKKEDIAETVKSTEASLQKAATPPKTRIDSPKKTDAEVFKKPMKLSKKVPSPKAEIPKKTSSPKAAQPVEQKAPVKMPEDALNKAFWESSLNRDIGEIPLLPENLTEILNSPCPFSSGKKVGDTHILALIVPSVTFDELDLTVKQKGFSFIFMAARTYKVDIFSPLMAESPYWILMTREFIKGSQKMDYQGQKDCVAKAPGYRLPNMTEVVLCQTGHHFMKKEWLFSSVHGWFSTSKAPLAFTRCEEEGMVAGYYPKGLFVDNQFPSKAAPTVGAVAVRRL